VTAPSAPLTLLTNSVRAARRNRRRSSSHPSLPTAS
jgi:hypothetical protein